MKLLWNHLKPHRRLLLTALILAALNQGFSLLDPQIFRLIIDRYASRVAELTSNQFISGVSSLLLVSVGVAFASRVAKNFQDYYVNAATQKTGTDLYAKSVKHSLSLPYLAFEDQRSGELLSKLEKARSDSQALISSLINVVFLSAVSILFAVVYAFIVHAWVGAAYLFILPALGAATFFLGKRIKETQRDIVKESANLAGSTTETIRNVELVKGLGLEKQEIDRLNRVNDAILGLELKKIKLIRFLSFTQGTLVNAMRSGLMLLMLLLVFRLEMSLGEFFSLLFYSFFVFSPLGEIGVVWAGYHETKASLEQLDEILKKPPEVKSASAQDPGELDSIEFRQVSFSYAGKENAIQNISFSISDGETIAFVGPSGSGKSTLVKLLVGLYKPRTGDIFWNGVPGAKADYDKIRSRIGLVLQETQLFAGTVRENLLFGRPEAQDEECLEALRLASIAEKFEKARGLDTKIGEGGIKLSGGERQRLAIARALLRNPNLFIFDEATSSLDSMTERAITQTIKDVEKARPNLITILVAHRLSTVSHADRIYVIENGGMAESGTHEELLRNEGL